MKCHGDNYGKVKSMIVLPGPSKYFYSIVKGKRKRVPVYVFENGVITRINIKAGQGFRFSASTITK